MITDRITYQTDLQKINWHHLKAILAADHFDNGRTPEQLKQSFANSYATVFALVDGQLIGKARALSDGVCNAYIVDVWTLTAYRRQGIATTMMRILLSQLKGQHVYLFTDDMIKFYEKLGFQKQDVGLGLVVGRWLER